MDQLSIPPLLFQEGGIHLDKTRNLKLMSGPHPGGAPQRVPLVDQVEFLLGVERLQTFPDRGTDAERSLHLGKCPLLSRIGEGFCGKWTNISLDLDDLRPQGA